MNCPDCKTIIHDDDIRNCPICNRSLYKDSNPMDPADYDPAEDADAPPEAYMKPTVVTDIVTDNGNGDKPKRRVIKHRRKINHRKDWIDPRRRKKEATP